MTGEFTLDTSNTGKPVKCLAAIAYAPNEPLKVEEITVDPPKDDEVRVRVLYNALCHTDVFTHSGQDSEGIFPSILGHEGAGIVESVGTNVTSLQVGDHVIPLYTAECKECKFCKSGRTNLCQKIRVTQGKGLMPDGTTRFKNKDGKTLYHYMGTSTFSQFTVLPEISVCKIQNKSLPLDKICLFACGVTTGIGAVQKTAQVFEGANVGVFGLGAVGLACIQGAVLNKAKRIVAIDTNTKKFELAKKMGATDCVNPKDHEDALFVQNLIQMTDGGFDFTFECIGNVKVMRQALECCHKGWGVSTIIGVAPAGAEISTRPFQLVTGRVWQGSAFGGIKSRSELPHLIQQYADGKIKIDDFITHQIPLSEVNKSFDYLHEGTCIRTVIKMF